MFLAKKNYRLQIIFIKIKTFIVRLIKRFFVRFIATGHRLVFFIDENNERTVYK